MRRAAGWLLMFALFSLGLWCFGPAASGASSLLSTHFASSSAAIPTTGESLASNPFELPGIVGLATGNQGAVIRAYLANPVAIGLRTASRSSYAHESGRQALATDVEMFPGIRAPVSVESLPVPAGARVLRYIDPHAAAIQLPDGHDTVVESAEPIATGSKRSALRPIDLQIKQFDTGFQAASSPADVLIPTTLSSGIRLSTAGLTITPLDVAGSRFPATTGIREPSSIFYPNTEVATDTVLAPTAQGFEIDTILRSAQSPRTSTYRLSLPTGTRLEQHEGGPVIVLRGRRPIAYIALPTARDAAGLEVPVTMTIDQDDIAVSLHGSLDDYEFPIAVDPEFTETTEPLSESGLANWTFTGPEWTSSKTTSALSMERVGPFPSGTTGEFSYEIKGNAKIYKFSGSFGLSPSYLGYTESEGYKERSYSFQGALMQIRNSSGENHEAILTSPGKPWASQPVLCAETNCGPGGQIQKNGVNFAAYALESSASYENGGSDEKPVHFVATLEDPTIYIAGLAGEHSTTEVNNTSGEIDHTPNIFDNYNEHWLGPNSGAFEVKATDKGLGVEEMGIQEKHESTWGGSGHEGKIDYANTAGCHGVQCSATEAQPFTANSQQVQSLGLVNGENTIRFFAHSALPKTLSTEYGSSEETIKYDNQKPHIVSVSGLPQNAAGEYEIGEVSEHLRVEASDGEGTIKSSGIASIQVYVDEREIGKAAGACEPGPCSGSGEWIVNGTELGAGQSTLVVKVTDHAGNVETKTTALNIYNASPIALGPGSVNPESGDFALEATDVSLSGGTEALSVSRHYDSLNPTEGEGGAIGAQWTLSLSNPDALEVLPDHSVMLLATQGIVHFAYKEGKLEAPVGDANLKLEYEPKGPAYVLRNEKEGSTLEFTEPAGASEWLPTVSKGPASTDSVTDEYRVIKRPGTEESILQPTREIAAHPSATCTPEHLEAACRGLELVYDEGSTTASGEAESDWGEYAGQLKEVKAITYSPSEHKILHTPVAAYLYDAHGRLRAEWDPRITPKLVTTYGYDASGHLTALTPPGQQTWVFTYGTIPNDPSSGRLIKADRAPANHSLWNGEPVVAKGVAVEPNTPIAGVQMAARKTEPWQGEPTSYAYEWERCQESETHCAVIEGATNPNYTPKQGDVGYWIRARISATNGDGSVSKTSPAVGPVAAGETVSTNQTKCKGQWLATGSDGNFWITCPQESRIAVASPTGSGEMKAEYELPANSYPEGITAGPESALWYADEESGKIGRIYTTGERHEFTLPAGVYPADVATVSTETDAVFYTNPEGGTIGRLSTTGAVKEWATPTESKPAGVAGGGNGALWFTEDGTKPAIGELTMEGVMKQFPLPAGSAPYVISDAGDGLWFTELNGKVGFITYSGAISEYSLPPEPWPDAISGIAETGGAWFTDRKRLDKINSKGEITEYGLPVEAETVAPVGEHIWFNGRKGESYSFGYLNLKPGGGAEHIGPEPGETIEYNVPLEGSEAPQQMGVNATTHKPEVEAWGQVDDPTFAMSMYPPTKPMEYPASSHTGATTYYLDGQARTVNVASPAGGISTTEYNKENQTTRTLSAQNRASALKEANPSTAAQLLSTVNAYTSEGMLEQTWGPQHVVMLASGEGGKREETLARQHVRYYYDAGAEEEEKKTGEKFGLVTKTITGAETPTKKEYDTREATTGYGGQDGLGWRLRKPTSQTTDPTGLDLTTTTTYEEATGNVVETTTPAGNGKNARVAPAFISQFGSKGSGAGQLSEPTSDALDAEGNLWVADIENHRLVEYSPEGTFVKALGFGVANGEAKLETCTSTCKAGIVGTGNGQLSYPVSVAISGGYVYALDYTNDRVEKYNERGEWVAQFGKEGTGAGQLKSPVGIAVSGSAVWVGDLDNSRYDEFTTAGTFVETIGFGVSTTENTFQICKASCKAGKAGSGNGQFNFPQAATIVNGTLYVADCHNHRVEEFNEKGEYVTQFGTQGSGAGQLEDPTGLASVGGALYVTDTKLDRVEVYTTTGEFLTEFDSKGSALGQNSNPEEIAANGRGTLYIVDSVNDRVQQWVPTDEGALAAYTEKTIYYSASENPAYPKCGEHPEWSGLPCESLPSAQPASQPAAVPGVAEVPELPVRVTTYNTWDQPEVVTETFGSTRFQATKRIRKTTFDPAGRAISTEETASPVTDTAMGAISNAFNTTTGLLETETVGGKTITSHDNTLGELETYTDSDGNTATYSWDADGRVTQVKDSSESGSESQTYEYNETSGELTGLTDSGIGKFAATYTPGGLIASQTYPNGITASYTYNSVGAATGVEYVKASHCTGKECDLYNDSLVPSIFGSTMTQSSTLANQPSYRWDNAGRLVEVQETPAGEGCQTTLYSYDESGNRASSTSRAPATEGKCASEGGTTEWHIYDTGNRLADPSVTYDAFGDTTTLPAADAGGSTLTSTFYVDGQVATQSQGEETNEYKLDPEARPREIISTGKTASTVIDHYDGPGPAVAWTSEPSKGSWTRDIPGITGYLAATKTSSGTVEFQLQDLDDDIVATIGSSESETKLKNTYRATPFGVPSGKGQPPKFAWLGGSGISSELSSGTITEDGVTYVPQSGAVLQTSPVTPPVPAIIVNPVVTEASSWLIQAGLEAAAHQVALAEAAKAAAEAAALGVNEEGYESAGEAGPCFGCAIAAGLPTLKPHVKLKDIGCELSSEPFGFEDPGELFVHGAIECGATAREIELQVCLWLDGVAGSEGTAVECLAGNTDNGLAEKKYDTKGWPESGYQACVVNEDYYYQTMVWGWFYGKGGLVAVEKKLFHHSNKCSSFSVDSTGFGSGADGG